MRFDLESLEWFLVADSAGCYDFFDISSLFVAKLVNWHAFKERLFLLGINVIETDVYIDWKTANVDLMFLTCLVNAEEEYGVGRLIHDVVIEVDVHFYNWL